jgi:hypothetical protein
VQYTFVETTKFTQRITKVGLHDDLRELQKELLENPKKGDTEPGTGGLRKVRMPDSTRGQGKSFGARVHYAVAEQRRVIYLIFVYGKDEISTLSKAQKRVLRDMVRALVE